MHSQRSNVLTAERWVELLSAEHAPAKEEVILIRRLKKPYTLFVPKGDLKRCFGDCSGVQLSVGPEIRMSASSSHNRTFALSDRIVQRLGLSPGGLICISRRRDDEARLLKRFEIGSGESEVPGRVVVDSFGEDAVIRTHYSRTDINAIHWCELKALVSKMGTFRYDPIAAFQHAGGRVGFLFRSEFKGYHTEDDRVLVREYIGRVLDGQRRNGSWDDNLVATAFRLIRLAEVGETTGNPAVARAARWLLSSPEPAGLPGLLMATEELVHEFNQSKRNRDQTGRSVYHKVSRSKSRKYQPIRDAYQQNREIVPGVCELALTSSSAVALQALLRLGFAEHKRVRMATNTLLSLWNGRWCGCGYFDPDRSVTASDKPVDFSGRLSVPSENRVIYHLDWFTETKQLMQMTAMRKLTPCYTCWQVSQNEVLVERQAQVGNNCTLGVHEALSYYPGYAGSNLEANAALEYSIRQSSCGHWGGERSMMLHNLTRLSHPLAAFFVLRSIPGLIREQQADGLWSDSTPHRADDGIFALGTNSPEEVASFRILMALKHFGFLDALLPAQEHKL